MHDLLPIDAKLIFAIVLFTLSFNNVSILNALLCCIIFGCKQLFSIIGTNCKTVLYNLIKNSKALFEIVKLLNV